MQGISEQEAMLRQFTFFARTGNPKSNCQYFKKMTPS
jgi:hypothetical protein